MSCLDYVKVSVKKRTPTSYDEGVLFSGAMGNRTPDLFIANETLYQLSYGPDERFPSRFGALATNRNWVSNREWAIQDLNL